METSCHTGLPRPPTQLPSDHLPPPAIPGNWDFPGCPPRPVRRGISKGVEDGRRPPCGWTTSETDVRPFRIYRTGQDIDRLGMVGPGKTLESLWIPLAIRAFPSHQLNHPPTIFPPLQQYLVIGSFPVLPKPSPDLYDVGYPRG